MLKFLENLLCTCMASLFLKYRKKKNFENHYKIIFLKFSYLFGYDKIVETSKLKIF